MLKNTVLFMTVTAIMTVTSGCTPFWITAGAVGATKAGVAISQDRSVGSAVDDTTIWTQIKALFFKSNTRLFANVSSQVNEGRVLLTGKVTDPETRVEAVRLAWQPDGVKEVINEIQVTDQSQISDYATDAWINTQVKSALLFNMDVKSINYSVDTVNRIVYLVGIAQSDDELSIATKVAGSILGVEKVVSYVRVKDAKN